MSEDPPAREPEPPAPEPAAGEPAASQPPAPELTRLDPDAAAERSARVRPAPPRAPAPAPVIDVRPYRWAVGVIGLVLVLAVGIVALATRHRTVTGVPAGERLHWFAAARADTSLRGNANLHPTCRPAAHDPRALNLCIDAHRAPVVLSLFIPGSASCVHQVDALQALSHRFSAVRFVAVAVHASRASTLRLVRSHHWTIPVAEDPDGAVAEQYGVVICPMVELASRGGIVRDRLIGDRWATARALTPRVEALLR